MTLAQDVPGRGNVKQQQSAVKLYEVMEREKERERGRGKEREREVGGGRKKSRQEHDISLPPLAWTKANIAIS